ncbi:hypothetical protein [Desulfocurvibacter africanus]|nr:hypothetical protein [Desulfocurvibacter africanus]
MSQGYNGPKNKTKPIARKPLGMRGWTSIAMACVLHAQADSMAVFPLK